MYFWVCLALTTPAPVKFWQTSMLTTDTTPALRPSGGGGVGGFIPVLEYLGRGW